MATEPSDSDLLAAIGRGEEAALRLLVERHSAWLTMRLRRRTRDDDLVAEAVHDTFVTVWRKPRGFRGEGEVAAWLWGIAIRQLLSRLRRRSAPTPFGDEVVAARAATVVSAEDQLLVALEYGPVGDALRTLSPEFRQVLQATVLDGLTTREAAQLLGIPQGTVKSRTRLAKARLREHLLPLEGWS